MSLVNNIEAFTNVLGAKNPDIVFGFASIDWKNPDERDQFISELVKLNDNKKIGE
jgi:hypothetical protein